MIFQFVHKTLADTHEFCVPRIMAGGVDGEIGKHTGIPVFHTSSIFVGSLILDIKTPAGGADIGTGTAVEAGKGNGVPVRFVVEIKGFLFVDIFKLNSGYDFLFSFFTHAAEYFYTFCTSLFVKTSALYPGVTLVCHYFSQISFSCDNTQNIPPAVLKRPGTGTGL